MWGLTLPKWLKLPKKDGTEHVPARIQEAVAQQILKDAIAYKPQDLPEKTTIDDIFKRLDKKKQRSEDFPEPTAEERDLYRGEEVDFAIEVDQTDNDGWETNA